MSITLTLAIGVGIGGELTLGWRNWKLAVLTAHLETSHVRWAVVYVVCTFPFHVDKVKVHNLAKGITLQGCTTTRQSRQAEETLLTICTDQYLSITVTHAAVKIVSDVVVLTVQVHGSRANKISYIHIHTDPSIPGKVRYKYLIVEAGSHASVVFEGIWDLICAVKAFLAVITKKELLLAFAFAKGIHAVKAKWDRTSHTIEGSTIAVAWSIDTTPVFGVPVKLKVFPLVIEGSYRVDSDTS